MGSLQEQPCYLGAILGPRDCWKLPNTFHDRSPTYPKPRPSINLLIKACPSNHIGILVMILGTFLNSRVLEVLERIQVHRKQGFHTKSLYRQVIV